MLSRANQIDVLSAGAGVQTTDTVSGIASAGKASPYLISKAQRHKGKYTGK